FSCCNSGLDNVYNISCLCNRLVKLSGIGDECLDISHHDALINDKESTNNTNEHIAYISDKDHHWMNNHRNKLCSSSSIIELFIHFIKMIKGLFFLTIGFDNGVSCIHFLDMPI